MPENLIGQEKVNGIQSINLEIVGQLDNDLVEKIGELFAKFLKELK